MTPEFTQQGFDPTFNPLGGFAGMGNGGPSLLTGGPSVTDLLKDPLASPRDLSRDPIDSNGLVADPAERDQQHRDGPLTEAGLERVMRDIFERTGTPAFGPGATAAPGHVFESNLTERFLAAWPSSGMQSLSYHGVHLDLGSNRAYSNGGSLANAKIFPQLEAGRDVSHLFKTIMLLTDDEITVDFEPGFASTGCSGPVGYTFPIDGVKSIFIRSATPLAMSFCIRVLFSPYAEPLGSGAITQHMERYGEITLTKTEDADAADDFGITLKVVAANNGNRLDESTYGTNHVRVADYGSSALIVHNADGADSVDVNLQGLLSFQTTIGGAGSQGMADQAWVDDPSTGSSSTIANGNAGLILVPRQYEFIRLRTRVNLASAADATAAIRVQALAHTVASGG
tara:strand:+ start:58 stop:1251 length:1194 start_codon:yes stop_codon:yes gene_type:complete